MTVWTLQMVMLSWRRKVRLTVLIKVVMLTMLVGMESPVRGDKMVRVCEHLRLLLELR